jgi:tetratricopeptide (TPR) repeat protein
MRILLPFLFIIFSLIAYSQDNAELMNTWKNNKLSNSTRLKALSELITKKYLSSNPDSAIYYSNILITSAKKEKLLLFEAKGYNQLGAAYYLKANHKEARTALFNSLEVSINNNTHETSISTYDFLGHIYDHENDLNNALKYRNKSLELAKEYGNEEHVATSINNLGITYFYQGNYVLAKKYFKQAMDMSIEQGDMNGIASGHTNIGNIYIEYGETKKAITEYNKAIAIYRKEKDLLKKYGVNSRRTK